MDVYLGLGSNCEPRRTKIEQALAALRARDVQVLRVSPLVESPALLPDGAPPDWNRPFLNVVAECRVRCNPQQLLAAIHVVERDLGRSEEHAHWSPRPIDIDILLWGAETIATDSLRVPHPALTERSFVLSPLAALNPALTIPGAGNATVLQRCRALRDHIPLWMGILNVTPDSFSDGGRFIEWPAIEAHVENMSAGGAQIIDIGAESTRPGAATLSAADELARLLPPLEHLLDKYRGRSLRPRISVDTYHADVARRAVELGADIVNDVGGLTDPAMIEIAADAPADWVAMHNLGLPADPSNTLPAGADACDAVQRWLEQRIESWTRAGLDTARVIFDPGIGFGKNPLQSLALLRGIRRFQRFDLRLLVGHSRKSFMGTYAKRDNRERDLATIGASMYLCSQGIDIIRVHNVPDHVTAYRGWAHMMAGSSRPCSAPSDQRG